MKFKSNNLLSFFITWIVIPGLLFGLWLGASLFFTSKYSFSVIASPYENKNFTSYKTSELYKGEKLAARFEARENNLGIVSVRFYNFQRISNDVVVFRIKEVGKKNWLYENRYRVDQFQPDELFTFGFPIIPDSKGKTYFFEIESTKGRRGDAIGLSKVYPPLVTQYQYSKDMLFSDKAALLDFFLKKMYYSFTDRNFLISSLVFLLPLIFYLVWCYIASVVIGVSVNQIPTVHVHSKKIISESVRNGYVIVHLYFAMLFLLIIMMDQKNMFVSLLLIGLWIWQIKIFRFDSSVTYFLSLFLLVMCLVFLIFQQQSMAERSAIWVFTYLVIGTFHAFFEVRKNDKKRVSYPAFLRQNYDTFKNYFKRFQFSPL